MVTKSSFILSLSMASLTSENQYAEMATKQTEIMLLGSCDHTWINYPNLAVKYWEFDVNSPKFEIMPPGKIKQGNYPISGFASMPCKRKMR